MLNTIWKGLRERHEQLDSSLTSEIFTFKSSPKVQTSAKFTDVLLFELIVMASPCRVEHCVADLQDIFSLEDIHEQDCRDYLVSLFGFCILVLVFLYVCVIGISFWMLPPELNEHVLTHTTILKYRGLHSFPFDMFKIYILELFFWIQLTFAWTCYTCSSYFSDLTHLTTNFHCLNWQVWTEVSTSLNYFIEHILNRTLLAPKHNLWVGK